MLDLSFNRIKEINGLTKLLNLKKLFISSNKISEIKNVNHLPKLELLELGDNRLRVSLISFLCRKIIKGVPCMSALVAAVVRLSQYLRPPCS